MNIDFIRFPSGDGVELQGWYANSTSDIAMIHVHGMSGNGYENYFLDNLHKMYIQKGISVFTFDTRGRGIISSFRKNNNSNEEKLGGSCYEIFEESIYDIQGAIDYLKSQGKSRFILQGHSLGSSKVVNYLINTNKNNILSSILLAPTDMIKWAAIDINHEKYLQKSKDLISQGQYQELVGSQCWIDKTPLSAQTYLSLSKKEAAVDIYSKINGKAKLGMVEIPMLIVYGSNDIGIKEIDGSVDNWLDRVLKIKNIKTSIEIIDGAPHSFKDCEEKLAEIIKNFLNTLDIK